MGKITITEPARRLGVSVCAVNKAFAGKPKGSDKTRRLFREHPEVRGLYAATDNFGGIFRGLKQQRRAGRVKVVATGVFPEIRDAMDQGLVQFSLHQRMAEQGDMAVQCLHDVLLNHRLVAERVLLPPRVVVQGNIQRLDRGSSASSPRLSDETPLERLRS